jgi:MFS family permease
MGAVMSLIAISTANPTLILLTAVLGGIFGSLHGVSEPAFMAENSEDYERVHLFSVADGTRTAAAIIGSVLAGLMPLLLVRDAGQLIFTYRMVAYVGIIIWFGSLIPALLLKKTSFDEQAKEPLTFSKMFANIKNPDRIFKLSLPAAIIGLGAGFTLPLMNVYFHKGLGSSEVEIGAIFAAGQALLVVASFLAPLIAARLGKVRAIVTMQLISIPFILLLAYATELGSFVGSIAVVAVMAYVARITTMDVTGPIREAFGMEILDPAERGTQVGIQRAATAALYGGAGFIGGFLMNTGDFRTPFLLMAAFYLCSVMLFWSFFGRQKQHYVQEVETLGQGAD